jgi:hypothetical protein
MNTVQTPPGSGENFSREELAVRGVRFLMLAIWR